MKAVEQGLKGEAATAARTLLREKEPLELVDGALIPALDAVGAKYENGTLFLPQLLQAASAAQSAFDEVKTAMAAKGGEGAGKGRIVLATVHGDVHDIGKNIVKVILENYGFEVIDLGRDVPVEAVVDAGIRQEDRCGLLRQGCQAERRHCQELFQRGVISLPKKLRRIRRPVWRRTD